MSDLPSLGNLQDELKQELADLEQEELDSRLMADSVPVHHPGGPSRVESSTPHHVIARPSKLRPRSPFFPFSAGREPIAEDDEEAQLKELQAALAM